MPSSARSPTGRTGLCSHTAQSPSLRDDEGIVPYANCEILAFNRARPIFGGSLRTRRTQTPIGRNGWQRIYTIRVYTPHRAMTASTTRFRTETANSSKNILFCGNRVSLSGCWATPAMISAPVVEMGV